MEKLIFLLFNTYSTLASKNTQTERFCFDSFGFMCVCAPTRALMHTQSQWVASLCSSRLLLSSMACSTWLKTVMASCGYVVTLCPCSRSGMPVHLQTGKHLPETWEGITQPPLLRSGSIWRAGLSSTQSQMHIIHRGHVLESSNIFILSDVPLFLHLLLFFPPPIASVSALVFFIHRQIYPRVKNPNRHQKLFSSCFCSPSLLCLSQTVGSVFHASTFIIVRQTFPGAIDRTGAGSLRKTNSLQTD